ncbi:MAG TPA: SH3 domain-containing protein [Devosiaceae bacterium]|nr:SH3 domain-containing protein [Devosiaceae bacterium]
MNELLLGRVHGRFSVGLAAGVITLVVILVIVGMALPFGCPTGLSWDGMCTANTAKAAASKPAALEATTAAVAAPVPAKPAAVAAPAQNAPVPNLVAATFSSLNIDPAQTPATAPATADPQIPSLAGNVPTGGAGVSTVARRMVKTIAVSPDSGISAMSADTSASTGGWPDAAPAMPADPITPALAPAPAPASDPQPQQALVSAPAPLATPADPTDAAPAATAPAATASAKPAIKKHVATRSKPAAAKAKAAVANPATTPTSGTMRVKGTGVSVRSGPAKSDASVFSLAGGQTVTVTGAQKGWVHITDGQGRDGWAYSTFLTKVGS